MIAEESVIMTNSNMSNGNTTTVNGNSRYKIISNVNIGTWKQDQKRTDTELIWGGREGVVSTSGICVTLPF